MSLVFKSEKCEAQKCQAHLSETSSTTFNRPLIKTLLTRTPGSEKAWSYLAPRRSPSPWLCLPAASSLSPGSLSAALCIWRSAPHFSSSSASSCLPPSEVSSPPPQRVLLSAKLQHEQDVTSPECCFIPPQNQSSEAASTLLSHLRL